MARAFIGTFVFLFLLVGATAGPGEIGRPKVIPRFESWEGRTHRPPSSELLNLVVFDLKGQQIPLKDLWSEKPLLLVHSSLTCPISRDNCPRIDRLQEQFKDEVEIIVLYTTEAHPVGSPSPYSEGGLDEWITDRNLLDKILVDEPRNLKARLKRAREYRDKNRIKSRMVVDGMDNKVWKHFGGGPNTGTLISRRGTPIAHQGWIKPSAMAGEIRAIKVNEERQRIRDQLKEYGLEVSPWQLDAAEISTAARKVPDLARYHINTKGFCHDETFLHLATGEGNAELTTLLLDLGAPPDIQDRSGKTPLHYALLKADESKISDYSSVVEILLKRGADIRRRSDDLLSSLHFAVRSGRLAQVEKALAAGAPLDAYSIDTVSPLHEALYLREDEEISKFLLAQGAVRDIYVAAALGDLKAIKRFLQVRPDGWQKFQGDSGRSPLLYATIAGQTETVIFLLSLQSETVRYSNEHLNACLAKAVEFEQSESALAMVSQALPLVGENAPPSFQSLVPQVPPLRTWWSFTNPLLHEAAAANEHLLIEQLLELGWEVDELNDDEETPLHFAARAGSLESVETLLRRGANLHTKSGTPRPLPCGPPGRVRKNNTALHLAVDAFEVDTVRSLLEKGAPVNTNNTAGETPIFGLLPSSYHLPDQNDDGTALKTLLDLLLNAGATPDAKADCGKSFREAAAEMVPDNKNVDGLWTEVGQKIRSAEILKLLSK